MQNPACFTGSGCLYDPMQIYESVSYHTGKICGMQNTEYAKKPYVYYPYPFPADAMSGNLEGVDLTWATCVGDFHFYCLVWMCIGLVGGGSNRQIKVETAEQTTSDVKQYMDRNHE